MGELVEFLIAEEINPFQAIKNLHDWIALTIAYDYEGFFSGAIPEQDPWKVLASGKAVCAGYAALFQRFCQLAGIRCTIVSGYSRGYGYDVFADEAILDNHSWNAVKVEDAWYLIDVTWDAGHISNGRFKRDYSTDYFLLPAEHMIYTHFPATSTWQLLPVAVSTRQFLALPQLEGRFFKYPFSGYNELQRIYPCDEELVISLTHEPEVQVQAELADEKKRTIPQAVFIQPAESGTDIRIRPQAKGQYELRVFAGSLALKNLEHVWSTAVAATAAMREGFPQQFGAYPAFGCKLISPLAAPLRIGDVVDFDLAANTDEILVVAGGTRQTYTPDSDGRFMFSMEIPRTNRLEIFAKELRLSSYSAILQFTLAAK